MNDLDMNDLDLVRTMRAEVPSPSPARLARGRDRLLAAASRPRRHRLLAAVPGPRRHRLLAAVPGPRRYRRPIRPAGPGAAWRLALPAGAIVAVAAIVCAAVLGGTAAPSRPGSAAASRPGSAGSHPRPAPTARVSLAARFLTLAARTVAAEPVSTRPGDRQWVYARFVQTQTGTATQSDENWIRFDGLEQAYYLNGQLITHLETSGSGGPLDSYRELADLPADPAAILAAAGQVVGTTPQQWENWSSGSAVAELAPRSIGEAEFDYLAQLLWDAYAAAPPAALAHVYQAMADIPGVTVTGGLTSAVGRAGIGVSANGGVSWLLLDPQTYQVIGLGEKALSRASVMVKGSPITFSGTISMAWADVAIVAAPGQRLVQRLAAVQVHSQRREQRQHAR